MSEKNQSNSPAENEQAIQGETIDPLHSALVDEHVEEVEENGRKVRHRGIYLLPNLFTTAALFSGFYAIIAGMNGNFEAAAIAIFVAMVLDGLDGRVARLTNTSSAFGEQYDSLSDMVSFGVAPALVMFSWALQDLGKFGWAAAFTYCAGAALRLARFNTQIGVVDKRYFIGLASPSAAALVAGTVWAGHDVDPAGVLAWVSALVAAFAGIMMVSNVRYTSFKDVDFKGRVPFVVMLVVVLAFAIITIDPPRILLAIFAGYACSGPFMAHGVISKDVELSLLSNLLVKAAGRAIVKFAPLVDKTPPSRDNARPSLMGAGEVFCKINGLRCFFKVINKF